MGCYAILTSKQQPTFQRVMVPSSLGCNSPRLLRHWNWRRYAHSKCQ